MCWSAVSSSGGRGSWGEFIRVCSAVQHHVLCVASGNSSVATSPYPWRELLGITKQKRRLFLLGSPPPLSLQPSSSLTAYTAHIQETLFLWTRLCRTGKSGDLAKLLHPNVKCCCLSKTCGPKFENPHTPPSISHPDAFCPSLGANRALGAREEPGPQRGHPAGCLQPPSPSHQHAHRSQPALALG